MSFPDAWVDRIFRKLSLTYGADFLRRYEGLSMADVRTDWAAAMEGFEQHPEAIAYALQHLPERPPNVLEFRAICRHAPPPPAPMLPAPKPDPARLADELRKLAPLRKSLAERGAVDPKAWAYRLRDREAAGDRLSSVQRRFWREALENN